MIEQILAAIKISLKECNKFTDPVEYIYEINQVLNRYKSNLYKAFTAAGETEYDAKEFIHFRIASSWTTRPGFDNKPKITVRSPVMLYVNGFTPTTERINKENQYNRALDISDIISLERIASIRDDYHTRSAITANKGYMSEVDEILERYYGTPDLSVYFLAEAGANDNYSFSFQINSVVFNSLVKDEYISQAAKMASDPHRSLKELARKTKLPVDIKMDVPEGQVKYNEQPTGRVSVTKPAPRLGPNSFFG